MRKATDPNLITEAIIDSAIEIHRTLGPGLLESVYESLLSHELAIRGLWIERQKAIPLVYKDLRIADAFRTDLIVNGIVLVELKSVETLLPVHSKQVITYLRLTNLKLGILLNFNAALLKNGIRRLVNGLPE